jgi:hypothetical protein
MINARIRNRARDVESIFSRNLEPDFTQYSVMMVTSAIADLRQQIHHDLRRQHPEWVLPNGESPMCDVYEARLMDLLALVPGLYYDDRPNARI